MNSWFYVLNGQRTGPVGADELQRLAATGAISAETLVWREGMADWQPLRIAAADLAGPAADGNAPVTCSSCGKIVPGSDAMSYGGQMICAACKPAFVQKLKEGGEGALAKLNYAGFGIRFGAKFIDGLILMVPMGILYGLMISAMMSGGAEGVGTVIVFQVLFYLLAYVGVPFYNAFFMSKYGATPGKMACKLKVVRSNGEPLRFGRAIGRAYADMLSGMVLYIGYIMVAFDNPERRALHDRICDTRVIIVKK